MRSIAIFALGQREVKEGSNVDESWCRRVMQGMHVHRLTWQTVKERCHVYDESAFFTQCYWALPPESAGVPFKHVGTVLFCVDETPTERCASSPRTESLPLPSQNPIMPEVR